MIHLFLLFIFGNTLLAQPSFDCAKVKSKIEKQICGNESLAKSDSEMAEKYSDLLKLISEPVLKLYKDDQKNWLKKRNTCLNKKKDETISCLQFIYDTRINALNNLIYVYKLPSGSEKESIKLTEKIKGLSCKKKMAPVWGDPEADQVPVNDMLLIQTTFDPLIIQFQFTYITGYNDDSCDAYGYAKYTGKNQFSYIHENFSSEEKCRFVFQIDKKTIKILNQNTCGDICTSKYGYFVEGEFDIKKQKKISRQLEVGPFDVHCGD